MTLPQKRDAQSIQAGSTSQPAKKQIRPGMQHPATTGKEDSDCCEDSISGEQEDVTNVRSQQKPAFTIPEPLAAKSLHDRLRSFLPDLAQSNEELLKSDGKNFEDVEEEDEHIVMELGLGVLEQQCADSDTSSSSSEDESNAGDAHEEADHARRLLRQEKPTKAKIEELG